MLEQIQSFLSEPLQQEQQLRVVEIYIRIVTTKSIKIKLPSQVQVIKLKQIIKEKFKIEIQDQILFLKGIKLNFDGIVLLQNKWIVHVIDKRLVDNQFISFHLKTQSLNFFKKQLPAYYTVKSDQILSQFIENNVLKLFSVRLSEVLIVQSGRFLKLNQSFKDQYVQSGTEINVLHVQRDKSISSVNSQNEKYSNKLKQGFQEKNLSSIHSKMQQLQLKNINKKESKNKIFQTQRVSKIMTARNHWPVSTSNNSFKFNKTTTSNLYLNSPRVNPKNKSIPVVVGQKQCNCRPKKEKETQIVSLQDRKKRQRQIRQMNLQKMIIKKQKQNQIQRSSTTSIQEQQLSKKIQDNKNFQAQQSSSLKLKKVKSLNALNDQYNRKKQQKLKCSFHNTENQQLYLQQLHIKNNPQKKHTQQKQKKKTVQRESLDENENLLFLL